MIKNGGTIVDMPLKTPEMDQIVKAPVVYSPLSPQNLEEVTPLQDSLTTNSSHF